MKPRHVQPISFPAQLFFLFSLLHCVYGMRAPLVNQYTPVIFIPKPHRSYLGEKRGVCCRCARQQTTRCQASLGAIKPNRRHLSFQTVLVGLPASTGGAEDATGSNVAQHPRWKTNLCSCSHRRRRVRPRGVLPIRAFTIGLHSTAAGR